MRSVLCLFFLSLLAALSNGASQAQKFGIASYQAPSGWKEEKGTGFISYSKIEGQTFGQIALYEYTKSKGDIQSDFDAQWKELVTNGREVSSPEKTKPETANGWTAMSGSGTWKLDGSNVATILTVYSNKKVCVSVMINFSDVNFAKEYVSLLESLTLDASKATTVASTKTNSTGLVGLWVDYDTENRGYQNGFPILTAGYFRREYLLNADGTYTYRCKDWSVFVTDILFIYESGTWKANGNQITFSPSKSSGGWWGKSADGRTTGWGKFKKGTTYKSKAVTYSFRLHFFEGSKDNVLILGNNQPTERERSSNGNAKNHEWRYTEREKAKSLIDNPTGFVIPTAPKAAKKTEN